MARSLVLFVAVIWWPSVAVGIVRTVGPADCSASRVNTEITSATDGDVIVLTCAGTVTWAVTVTIPGTKGLTIQGYGVNSITESYDNGSPETVASTHALTISSTANPVLAITVASGFYTRISGLKFTGAGGGRGTIDIHGAGQSSFRIDNNYFQDIATAGTGLHGGAITVDGLTGDVSGLIDHNVFHDCSYFDGYCVAISEMYKYGGTSFAFSGMYSWTRAFAYGGSDAVFIEDNLFENIHQYTRHNVIGNAGARFVARFNTFNISCGYSVCGGAGNDPIDAHGLCICATTGVGARGGEVYGNTFKGTAVGRVNMRGGEWLIYDNTWLNESTYGSTGRIRFAEYRASDGSCASCTTTCASIAGWQQCQPAGTGYPLAQQVVNSYVWNNLYAGVNTTPGVVLGTFYIQTDRDFFVSTSKPAALSAYTAFDYPHPLVSLPTAPTAVRITP